MNGVCRRMKYLTVSFPYSNDGFTQVFGGETAECVCQGLRNIFEYIGGVPALPRALRMPREVLQSICGLRKGQCRAQGRLCPRQSLVLSIFFRKIMNHILVIISRGWLRYCIRTDAPCPYTSSRPIGCSRHDAIWRRQASRHSLH